MARKPKRLKPMTAAERSQITRSGINGMVRDVTADDLVAKAAEQRRHGRIEEALVSANQATMLDPSSANAFWQLALCQLETGAANSAIAPLKKVRELAPLFAPGWTRLGIALEETGENKQTQECFERAVKLKPDEVDALFKLANIYQSNKQPEDELRVRTALDELIQLGPYELNRLGILYHEKKEFYTALRYYRRVAKESTAGLFNLGLVFSAPEVSQHADAVDIWRKLLEVDPNHDRVNTSINNLLPRLTRLRNDVLALSENVLRPNQWYSHYINPLDLLGFDNTINIDTLDSKAIQRAKKALLQEIELEDGCVAWMPALRIDRTRAMAICEDLNDARLVCFQSHVFKNNDLSAFLSRGFLGQFLVDDSFSPLVTIEFLENDPDGFGVWLSSRFAPQFDLVLTRALAGQCLPVVECLLSGRRWVRPADEDRCFDGAYRHIDHMLAPLRKIAETSETVRPTLDGIRSLLADGSMGEILGVLPIAFYKSQQEAATLLRAISIDCYNHHNDADLAKAILLLSSAFALKSQSLQGQFAKDLVAVEERIAEMRKNEAHLLINKTNCDITREGLRFGETFISADDIQTARWGTVVTTRPAQRYEFTMTIGGLHGLRINVGWIATQNYHQQCEYFDQMINAAFSFLMPRLINTMRQALKRGQRFRIGKVTISQEGVWFAVKRWFTTKTVLCPWSRCKSDIAAGDVILSDTANPAATATLPLHETDNALALHLIVRGVV